jgi:HEAT repeat protein
MPQAPTLSPDLVRHAVALARALSAAVRTWGLYPPEHPAVASSMQRFADALGEATHGAAFAFGVTPATLLVMGLPVPDETPVVEAARLLHDHDILQISFMGEVAAPTLQELLKLLTTAPETLRAAGGPAAAWAASGSASVLIEQIDYEKLLEDREIEAPVERRDDLWRSLVTAITQGRQEFDEAQQQRLLDISHSPVEIGELATDAIEPKRNLDGSPLITTQAATVLAVFRHLTGVVTVMEPDRLPDVLRNVASAAATLDPSVVLHMMQMDEGVHDAPILARIAAAFDDDKVAQLLATALARDGKASARLAQVFDTIAPDEDRKRRVLSTTRSLLSEQDFGKAGQFHAVWDSMETLLLSYDETPYVSDSYQASLEGAAARGEMLASRALPPELPEWVATLEQENVRALSVRLVADLLRIEEDAGRAAEIAHDMVGLVDDLAMAGDFEHVQLVLGELRDATARPLAPAAARAALTACGESPGFRDAAALLGDLDEAQARTFAECCSAIGPVTVQALSPLLQAEHESTASRRATAIVSSFGAAAAGPLASLADDPRWFVQRTAAILLGGTHSPDAVAPLQALLRRGDARVLRHVISALAGIDDPAASRALQTALRSASGDNRIAVVQALVAERDARVVPMLARILVDSDPFGDDHQAVLDTLDAARQFADDRAVDAIVTVMQRRKLFAGRKARAFKTAAVQALAAIGTDRSRAALSEAAHRGDRLLRRAARDAAGSRA